MNRNNDIEKMKETALNKFNVYEKQMNEMYNFFQNKIVSLIQLRNVKLYEVFNLVTTSHEKSCFEDFCTISLEDFENVLMDKECSIKNYGRTSSFHIIDDNNEIVNKFMEDCSYLLQYKNNQKIINEYLNEVIEDELGYCNLDYNIIEKFNGDLTFLKESLLNFNEVSKENELFSPFVNEYEYYVYINDLLDFYIFKDLDSEFKKKFDNVNDCIIYLDTFKENQVTYWKSYMLMEKEDIENYLYHTDTEIPKIYYFKYENMVFIIFNDKNKTLKEIRDYVFETFKTKTKLSDIYDHICKEYECKKLDECYGRIFTADDIGNPKLVKI